MSPNSVLLMLGLAAVLALGCWILFRYGRTSTEYRTLLIDADGTLFDFDRSERAALTDALAHFGIAVGDEIYELYHRHNDDCWKAKERGELTWDQLRVERFARTFADLEVPADPADATRIYEECLGHYQYPYPKVEKVCEKLSRKYDLYIVTNGLEKVQTAKLRLTTVPQFCKGVYISETVGVAKPAKEFFDAIFAEHPEIDPKTTLIIGDSLTSDMKGGNNAGIATCWVHRLKDPVPEGVRINMRIEKFTDVERVL